MPSLTTLQQLLVVSAAAWAIFPRWGGFAFSASWVLLWLGSRNRTARAARVLETNVGTLSALAPEALEHARTYPLAYVWPTTAERWGTTWQMSGLLSAILGGVFCAWALFTFTPWYLIFLVPLSATFLTGGAMARRIKVAERVKEDLQALRPLHDRISTVLGLKIALGQWPPEPAPDLLPPPAPKAPPPPP